MASGASACFSFLAQVPLNWTASRICPACLAYVQPTTVYEPSSLLKKLLRDPIAAARARSLLAYLSDMSRRLLRGSLHSGRSLRFFSTNC